MTPATFEARARRLLEEWLETSAIEARRVPRDRGADIVVDLDHTKLVVECKMASDSTAVAGAISRVKAAAPKIHRKAVPIVAVPFMGDVGKRLCSEADVSWFDLSGNAHIVAPRLRILIEGKPNKFVRRGRPSTAFAPKSARIARRLLIEPGRAFRQQELARLTGLDDGFTSRIVRRLEEDRLVTRAADGAVAANNPDLLLDAWAEAYKFDKHTILRGHVSARSSDNLLESISTVLAEQKVQHAITGLAAAWLWTEFSAFRLVTCFVADPPSDILLKAIGFREEPKGANVWIVVPDDRGVFDGASAVHGVQVVHPVQAYLDLMAHPERAKEAATELRSRRLRWNS